MESISDYLSTYFYAYTKEKTSFPYRFNRGINPNNA